MAKIKDLLQLDLTEDIKDVIDLEDHSEKELKYEIENYIVTAKISSHLTNFINLYQSNIKETGVWLSGFYGSGKSYLGKMLGYLLENRNVNGTPFRDRFIQRLAGLPNASIIENDILGLDHFDTTVVFLDIAKQNTKNGFAWTLFKNFLRTLGFLDDVFGYMEYGLFLNGEYDKFKANVKKIMGDDWENIQKNPLQVAQTVRRVLTQTIWDESTYIETKQYLDDRIKNYDAAKFRDELENYLSKNPEKRIAFFIDEVSEAVGQRKIDLLELEGISEALSNVPDGTVWTVAIAQEKLDDVIQNASINIQELNKVTDRFKTKIHLSSEEVDTVIKKRLLLKESSSETDLQKYYKENSGSIMVSTNLNAKFPTKTETAEDFSVYYPFHKYQFELLQKFLFAVQQKARTGGTERGMIIAAHTVLKSIKDIETYHFASADTLVDGGKKVLEGELERKFILADRVLEQSESEISGTKLMKTIYLLNEAADVPASAENIAKLYITDLNGYYNTKPKIEVALKALCEANLLLEKNGLYKITSDLEQKLIEEMNQVSVEFHYKRRELVENLKNLSFVSDISHFIFEGSGYNFHIASVQGDEIKSSSDKNINIQIASLYTVDSDRDEFIERIKFETQGNQGTGTLIPAMNHNMEIDKLIEEIYRYKALEDRYANDDDEKIRSIIKDFTITKQNRIKELNRLLEKSYKSGTLIYQFEESNLTDTNFITVMQAVQKKIISNTYTDRLTFQLTEDVGLKVLKEKDPKKLKGLFSNQEFAFFDSDGNFVGEGLKVVEKVTEQITSMYLEGQELERRLSGPPTNYAFGTIQTVLAVLMRAGRASMKYGGNTHFSFTDDEVLTVFSKSRDFKKASFKAITSALSTRQKQELVEHLKHLKVKKHLNRDFGYSTNAIELVTIISALADHFIQKINEEKRRNADFDTYFPGISEHLNNLTPFSIKITGDNYKEKAEDFLGGYGAFKTAIESINEVLEFITTRLSKVQQFRDFISHIITELEKLGGEYKNNRIFEIQTDFIAKFHESVVNNYISLEKNYQAVKDEYHSLMKGKHQEMGNLYEGLKTKAEDAVRKITEVDEELNVGILSQLRDMIADAEKHICEDLKIGYETDCQNCHFSLNEIISANQSIQLHSDRIAQILTQVQYPGGAGDYKPKEINLKADTGKFTVGQYRKKLQDKLEQVKDLSVDDIVVVK